MRVQVKLLVVIHGYHIGSKFKAKSLTSKTFLCLKLLSCGVEAPNKVEEEEEEEVNQALESGKSQI